LCSGWCSMEWLISSNNRDREIPERGILVSVDLTSFLERIFVASASEALSHLVEKVSARCGLEVPVRQSALDECPFF
jgi:hypothetical protein